MWVIESSSGKFETLTQDEGVATFCRQSGKNVIELEDDGQSLDEYIMKVQRMHEEALMMNVRKASPSMDQMLKDIEEAQLEQIVKEFEGIDSIEGIDAEEAEVIKDLLRRLVDSGDFPEGADVTVVKLNLGSIKEEADGPITIPTPSTKYS